MHDHDLGPEELEPVGWEALRRELSQLPVPSAPPLAAIEAKARAHRHRQGLRLASAGAIAAVAAGAVVPVLAASHKAPASSSDGVDLASFSVRSQPDGTVSLNLNKRVPLDAPALVRALARAGVPAVVRAGMFCSTSAPLSWAQSTVVKAQAVTDQGVVIRPRAIPRDAKLSIGYSAGRVEIGMAASNEPLRCVAPATVHCQVLSAGAVTNTAPAATTSVPAATTSVPAATTSVLSGAASAPARATSLPEATTPAPATTTPAAAATTTPAAAATTTPGPAATLNPGARPGGIPPAAVSWCQVTALPPGPAATTTVPPPTTALTATSTTIGSPAGS